MNGTSRMQSAQAQVLAAEVVLAEEHFQSLIDQLDAAKAEGRKIDELIKQTESSLGAKHLEAESLWAKREIVSRARATLDETFAEEDFPSEEQGEEYAEKRAALTQEWHESTEKITALSGVIAPMEEELRRLKFARGRSVAAVKDLSNAIAEKRGRQRF